jgi:hypothetical protein
VLDIPSLEDLRALDIPATAESTKPHVALSSELKSGGARFWISSEGSVEILPDGNDETAVFTRRDAVRLARLILACNDALEAA